MSFWHLVSYLWIVMSRFNFTDFCCRWKTLGVMFNQIFNWLQARLTMTCWVCSIAQAAMVTKWFLNRGCNQEEEPMARRQEKENMNKRSRFLNWTCVDKKISCLWLHDQEVTSWVFILTMFSFFCSGSPTPSVLHHSCLFQKRRQAERYARSTTVFSRSGHSVSVCRLINEKEAYPKRRLYISSNSRAHSWASWRAQLASLLVFQLKILELLMISWQMLNLDLIETSLAESLTKPSTTRAPQQSFTFKKRFNLTKQTRWRTYVKVPFWFHSFFFFFCHYPRLRTSVKGLNSHPRNLPDGT